MRQDIAIKWAEALESGEYHQGTDILQSRDGAFCCLGVLCDLAVKEDVIKREKGNGQIYFDGCSALIPEKVQNWAGMSSEVGARTGRRKNLISLNDFSGYSFKRIAKVIREEWETL